ncbi:MAG: bifunctional diaminohydroxyphosphoribosylaminopyrimidine deaminase/5-amino-6-(5-phosphoribosylamino)uracil reductase RibD [Cyclobacteriaceae bacterium]
MAQRQIYMQRALQLAAQGLGAVSPNPIVGCVIVYDDKIIAEGYHKRYGGPHAEVEAVQQVKDRELLKKCSVYVTLEPCSHQGKTPPCAPLLINCKVPEVVVASVDVNPLVSGRGLHMLQEAGINVKSGMMRHESDKLNKRFNTFFTLSRPYIILKWAQTSDGFIARENYDSKWISNELSRKLVHKWRTEEDAILISTNTGYYDNPRLNARDWQGKDPLRVVIDRQLRLGAELNIFDKSQPTLVYNLVKNELQDNLEYVKINAGDFFEELMADLYQRKIQSVLIEGGAAILNQLIQLNLWDEARVFTGVKFFAQGIKAPGLVNFQIIAQQKLLNDQLTIYKNANNIYI